MKEKKCLLIDNVYVNNGVSARWNIMQPLKLDNSLESAYDMLRAKSK